MCRAGESVWKRPRPSSNIDKQNGHGYQSSRSSPKTRCAYCGTEAAAPHFLRGGVGGVLSSSKWTTCNMPVSVMLGQPQNPGPRAEAPQRPETQIILEHTIRYDLQYEPGIQIFSSDHIAHREARPLQSVCRYSRTTAGPLRRHRTEQPAKGATQDEVEANTRSHAVTQRPKPARNAYPCLSPSAKSAAESRLTAERKAVVERARNNVVDSAVSSGKLSAGCHSR